MLVGKNELKILCMLAAYPELKAKEIAEIIFNKEVKYKSKEYSSVNRSLNALVRKGQLEKVVGKVKWRRKT